MISPNKNRVDFGKALYCGIDGYELDYAIGTSYNLDLEAMLFLPVSLFFGEELEISTTASNEMLTALTQVPEKVQLFCQKGKIAKPYYYHPILEFWSQNIEQIAMSTYDASFHPKVWLIRYTAPNKPNYYKFICTSRNLSKSTDWDLAITMDGFVGEKKLKKNRPLAEFVEFLNTQAQRKIKQALLDEIEYIHFELDNDQLDYHFFPIGNGWKHPIFHSAQSYDSLLCISPFLDNTSVKALAKKASDVYVLSKQYEIDKLTADIAKENVDWYHFNSLLELEPVYAETTAENNDSSMSLPDDEPEFAVSSGLHAKLFVTTQENENTWYIGSANCTLPTHSNRNIEFLTAIHSRDKSILSATETLAELTKTEKNSEGFFVPYEKIVVIHDAEAEQLDHDLRKTIFDLSQLIISATVTENDQQLYDYQISIPKTTVYKRPEWKLFLQPLSDLKGVRHEIRNDEQLCFSFENFELHRLTPFFLFTIYDQNSEKILKELVIKLDIEFPEHRMRKIFSSLIQNWDKLMKYISFLLAKDQVEPLVDLLGEEEQLDVRSKGKSRSWHAQFPIYEKLLIATSRTPHSVEQTIQLIDYLKEEVDVNGNPIVEPAFQELINLFSEFVNHERSSTN